MAQKINTGNKRSRFERDLMMTNVGSNIQLAFVRVAADPQRMGRLTVWVPEFGPDVAETYLTVSYGSPFAGASPISDAKTDDKTESGSQRSYGFWAVPPDVGNQVLVCFANGDPARGFWFACVYAQNMNHMVPGIGMNVSTDAQLNKTFDPYSPPVVEYNKKDSMVDPKSPTRPPDNELAQGLIAQGLTHDPERGVTNSSARREDISLALGLLTPGGSSISFDDSPDNSFIRFRTKTGAQIMVSETSGYIYAITKGGNSWVEISDGAIEMYSSAPISIRSEDDVNIQGDGDVNISAKGDLNLHAGGNVRGFGGANVEFAAGANLNTQAGGKASHSAGGDLAMAGGGSVGIAAGGTLVAESGGDNVRNGAQILDNSGGSSAISADEAAFKQASSLGGGASTICSRQPSHEPYHHPINASVHITPSIAGGVTTIKRADGSTVAAVTSDKSPVTKIGKFKVSQNVSACIYQASQRTGVPYANLMAIAAQESSFNPNAGASSSSAKGLFQFLTLKSNSTWETTYAKYGPNGTSVKNPGVLNNPNDACSNALMGAYYYKENQQGLAAAGLPSGPTEVYAAHFLGLTGAKKFLRAKLSDPNESASALLPSAASSNPGIFKPGYSVGAVYSVLDSKIGQTIPQWNTYQASHSGG